MALNWVYFPCRSFYRYKCH